MCYKNAYVIYECYLIKLDTMAEGTIKGFFLTCLLGGCNPLLVKEWLLGGKGRGLFSIFGVTGLGLLGFWLLGFGLLGLGLFTGIEGAGNAGGGDNCRKCPCWSDQFVGKHAIDWEIFEEGLYNFVKGGKDSHSPTNWA